MARNSRHHLTFAGDNPADQAALRPQALTKQQFGKRLYDLILKQDLNQSQLAKKAKLSRNQISTYVRGISYPSVESLKAVAKVLDVDPDVLLPNYVRNAIEADEPTFSMQISASEPDMAWLKITQSVMVDTAVAVHKLIRDDKAAAEIQRRRAARSA